MSVQCTERPIIGCSCQCRQNNSRSLNNVADSWRLSLPQLMPQWLHVTADATTFALITCLPQLRLHIHTYITVLVMTVWHTIFKCPRNVCDKVTGTVLFAFLAIIRNTNTIQYNTNKFLPATTLCDLLQSCQKHWTSKGRHALTFWLLLQLI